MFYNVKKTIPLFAIILFAVISVNVFPYVFAETLIKTSSGDTLDVKLDLDDPQAGEETKLKIEFINPKTNKTQEHIDYTIKIENNGSSIFGPIPLTHTSPGSVTIPVTLEDGTNKISLEIEGILFMPIPQESVSFDVVIGEQSSEKESSGKVPTWVKTNAEWWAKNKIDDITFVSGIQFLIQEEIISVSSNSSSDSQSNEIPKWIKNNADWWSQGLISDDDFLKGIEFLVQHGIISLYTQTSEIQFILGGVDLSYASPILGSKDATVTIIEFGDYQCPNCKKWFLNTRPDITTNYIDTGKVNLYFVDLAFLGDDSLPAAAATYCAEEQGLYWEYHSYLYSNQRRIDSGWANISSLQTYADVLGLDKNVFAKCIDSGRYDEAVVFNLEEAINQGVKATPSFIIIGSAGQKESIQGPQPYPVFEAVIESMLN